MKLQNHFNEDDIKAFEPENKIGLLATINSEGMPHITLITTLNARNSNEIYWGQFVEGKSKEHITQNPHTGFLVMNQARQLWRGKAKWTHFSKEGQDYEFFNNLPMWRYNAYFGIHTIHYMDLVELTERQSLPLPAIIASTLVTRFSKSSAAKGKGRSDESVMNNWTESFFNRLDTLVFLSYIGDDGYPQLIPILQCQTADSGRLAFHRGAYADELSALQPGQQVAVFALSLSMEDVLVRGTFQGFSRHRGFTLGTVDVDWVYNSMPPLPGQIYPPQPIEEIRNF